MTSPAPPFTLVTGNRNKLVEAELALGCRLASEAVDLPEIQSLDLEEVLRAKGDEAWRRLERPVVVEETGLELHAMGGFPGPLIKWMLEAMGPVGIARAVHALGDPRATARCALLYREGETILLAEGRTRGKFVTEPRGTGGFGWDPVFVPEGRQETCAELPAEVKDQLAHRGAAWRAFRRVLEDASIL
ncbi:MAG: non-canonical purine NTP pyrophosphatase [Acidobacteriota bacterium]